MLNKLGQIPDLDVLLIRNHLSANFSRLTSDHSTYAKGRKKYWLQHEWDLKDRDFKPAIEDKYLWDICKRWMPEADLGLVVYGDIGIKPHRDDSYAHWRGVAINLGQIQSWYYDSQYPEYRWTKNQNPPNPINHKIEIGEVFEFNTKNPHGANNPASDRWAIFLWRVSTKFLYQFNNP